MPLFNPERDTFGEIRQRRPQCLTAVMMVGQMSDDAGREWSS